MTKLVRAGRGSQELPPEIYLPLVDSLYKEGRTLFVGSIFAVGSVLLTYGKTGEPLLLICAVALAVVAGIRGITMRAYARARSEIATAQNARKWERRYVAGATTSVGLLGLWCFIAFSRTADPFAHLVSFSMTIAYVIGVFGRNFGSPRFVLVQIAAVGTPMIGGLLLFGTAYHWIFAALLIPFFLAVKFISERIRRTLLDAVIATREMTLLAERFDTALNNMPHGLCMFDAAHRLVVVNQMMKHHLGLPTSMELKGLTARQMVDRCVEAGTISDLEAGRLSRDLEVRLTSNNGEPLSLEARDGRMLALAFQQMENGGLVVILEDITERKIAEAKINHLARFDPLTGLPNRIVLRNRMDEALATCGPDNIHAIHFIDLDQFKQVNDTLGHSRGDMLLQAVADRLREINRDTDVIARFGGDEFVVLQSRVRSIDDASTLAKRILRALSRTYEIDGHEVVISASIGIAVAPRDGIEVDQLLKNADMALYRAKSESRGTWRFFKPEMDADAQARRSLELDLRNAVESDAFELHYQPLIDLKTKQIVACEALLRWPHPERGMVSPAEFIPVAEEMGLIIEIGKRVLRKACLECKNWPDDVRVAVNLSPIQFSRTNVASLLRETLAATGLPASRVEIEITETTLLQDTRKTRAMLEQLAAVGVKISLDDFGTGYSSLSYLHSFPLHKVKIDRSFLHNLAHNVRKLTLLRGMARLSAELGLRVAVEGIETDEELELILDEGCVDEAQGYLFSRPLPSEDIRELLRARTVVAQHKRIAAV